MTRASDGASEAEAFARGFDGLTWPAHTQRALLDRFARADACVGERSDASFECALERALFGEACAFDADDSDARELLLGLASKVAAPDHVLIIDEDFAEGAPRWRATLSNATRAAVRLGCDEARRVLRAPWARAFLIRRERAIGLREWVYALREPVAARAPPPAARARPSTGARAPLACGKRRRANVQFVRALCARADSAIALARAAHAERARVACARASGVIDAVRASVSIAHALVGVPLDASPPPPPDASYEVEYAWAATTLGEALRSLATGSRRARASPHDALVRWHVRELATLLGSDPAL
jgi:hypothetical protein